jgi:hypothetical protein
MEAESDVPENERKRGTGHAEPPGGTLRSPFDIAFPMVYATFFALIALGVHVKFFPIGGIGVESDFYESLAGAAQELWEGNFSVASYPYKGPFYSFPLALVHFFGGDWYTNGVALSLLSAAAGLIVLYRLLLRVFNRWLAVTATISVSLMADFFVHAHKACTDLLFFLLCFSAISLLLIRRWRWVVFVGAGIFSAFAFLTRYNGAYLLVGAAVVLLFVNPWGWPRRRRLIAFGTILLAFALVCAPWFVLSRAETGRVLATENLRNVTDEFYGGARKGDIPEGGFTSVSSLIAHDPVHFATHSLLNIPRHLWFDIEHSLGLRTAIPMVLGLLLLTLVPPTRKQMGFYTFGIVYFLSMCVVFRLPRFVLPVAPTYIAVAFAFLVGPHGERRSRLGRAFGDRLFAGLTRLTSRDSTAVRRTVPVVVAGILLLQVLGIVENERWYLKRLPLYILPAAQFLVEHAERAGHVDQQTVLARKPHIAYYSGMEYQRYPVPVTGSREFVTFAVEQNVDYIVYGLVEQMHYDDTEWLVGVENTAGVERIFSNESTRIYEVANWLDLDEADGRRGLASRLAHLQSLEGADDPEAVVLACREIHVLYSHNGRPWKAAEYLVRGFEAAKTIPDPDEADRQIRALGRDFADLSLTYLRLGREDEGAAVLEKALLELEHYWTRQDLVAMHTILSTHYTRQGLEEKALRHARAARDVADSTDVHGRSGLTQSPSRELEDDE